MARILKRYHSRIYGNYRIAYLKYGSFIGIALSTAVLLQTVLLPKFQPYAPETFITDGIVLVGMCIACYCYRDTLKYKRVMFKELILMGMGMNIVASVIYGLFLWFLCGQMFPDLIESFANYRIHQMPPAAESAEASLNVTLVRKYTAGDWAFIGAFRTFVISIIFAFISAIAFANEKPSVYEPNKHHQQHHHHHHHHRSHHSSADSDQQEAATNETTDNADDIQ